MYFFLLLLLQVVLAVKKEQVYIHGSMKKKPKKYNTSAALARYYTSTQVRYIATYITESIQMTKTHLKEHTNTKVTIILHIYREQRYIYLCSNGPCIHALNPDILEKVEVPSVHFMDDGSSGACFLPSFLPWTGLISLNLRASWWLKAGHFLKCFIVQFCANKVYIKDN